MTNETTTETTAAETADETTAAPSPNRKPRPAPRGWLSRGAQGKTTPGKAPGKTGSGTKSGRLRRPRGEDAAEVTPIGDFALIIGAMKSGTTSLYDYLVTHPEIAACRRKEPSFFAADKRKKLPQRYYRLWPDYDPARHRYAIEASVDYAKQPRYRNVTKRIGAFPARFKYIYLVRDPVDRIESHIAHNIAKGRVTAEDHAKMIPSAVSISRYGHQLDAFRRPLGDPEVLLLDFDELRRDPMTLLGRVVAFLGLDPSFTFALRAPSNTRKTENGGDAFRLSAEERERFRAELAPDMARFARAHGFDVARWGFTPEAFPKAFAAASRPKAGPRPAPKAALKTGPKAGSAPEASPVNVAPAAVAPAVVAPEVIAPEAVAPVKPALPAPVALAPIALAPAAPAPETPAPTYWDRRRELVYYDYVRAMVGRLAATSTSLIDVGSYNTSLSEEFDWIPERFALDIRKPYSSEKVTGISADFLTFEPGRRYDFATCFQVLEHIPDAQTFARRLLAVADRVLVSVPYLWPEGKQPEHVHDPVDEAKLAGWFGRDPDYRIVVQEPLREGGFSRRLIAYFHNVPGEKFDPAKLGRRPEPAATATQTAIQTGAEPGADPAVPRRRGAGYWKKRRDMMYYAYVRSLVRSLAGGARRMIDVGSHQTSLIEEFDWIPKRTALDIRRPYRSEAVRGIKADFLTFTPKIRYDFATCFQVLEHVPDAGAFARNLLAIADRVLVSVPYLWPEDRHAGHVHDPVDEAKLASWFGRAPDYQLVVEEPLGKDGRASRRLIAYYHNVPGEPFALRGPAGVRGQARAAGVSTAEIRAARAAAKAETKAKIPAPVAPAAPAPETPAPTYWDRRRELVYYDYVRAMVGRLAATSTSLIDVGSYNTSLSEEFDWIPERFALDIRKPYSSEKVTGISADFLTFEPGRRYDFATCFQVLEHIPDAESFARRLLAVADRVLVSVPYLWPEGRHAEHVHDPVDEAKLDGWFGREPDYRMIVQEPLRRGGYSRRMIAYFHNVPGESFDLRALPHRPAGAAAPEAGYWGGRRNMIYYDYIRAMVRKLGAGASSLIDVGSNETSLAEEFDWIPDRAALDLEIPYASDSVLGIKADFLTYDPGRRYDLATCFQVLEHVPDAGAFAQRLLGISDRVLVSVPYRWPEARHAEHVHDPVDAAKLAGWFGRAPDYQLVVREPLQAGAASRRLIAYYHDVPGETFTIRGRAGLDPLPED